MKKNYNSFLVSFFGIFIGSFLMMSFFAISNAQACIDGGESCLKNSECCSNHCVAGTFPDYDSVCSKEVISIYKTKGEECIPNKNDKNYVPGKIKQS